MEKKKPKRKKVIKDGEDWHRKQQENRTILVQFSKVNTQKLNVTNSHKSHTPTIPLCTLAKCYHLKYLLGKIFMVTNLHHQLS